MCIEFGSCFGSGSGKDNCHSTGRTERGVRVRRRRRADHGSGYYSGTDHKAPAPAYHVQPHDAAGFEETGHRPYHDGVRKDHADPYYGAYVHDRADNDPPKFPAWWHKFVDDAGYTDTTRLHETATDRRENGVVDYPTELLHY